MTTITNQQFYKCGGYNLHRRTIIKPTTIPYRRMITNRIQPPKPTENYTDTSNLPPKLLSFEYNPRTSEGFRMTGGLQKATNVLIFFPISPGTLSQCGKRSMFFWPKVTVDSKWTARKKNPSFVSVFGYNTQEKLKAPSQPTYL